MPTLGVAGGTSLSLGRAIVTALLSALHGSRWNIVVLSRSVHKPLWLRAVDPDGFRTQIRAVDYLSQDSLIPALKDVHTLISVTSAIDGTQRLVQMNLLHAAVKARCARFAPSQWGFGPTGWEMVPATAATVAGVWDECMKFKHSIECTRFNHGCFMNYLGHGIYSPLSDSARGSEEEQLRRLREGNGYAKGEDEACEGLQRNGNFKDGSGAFLLSMRNGTAELPQRADGQWPLITLTTMKDIGRFVAQALELPKWGSSMTMVGETLTMGKLLAHAEAVAKRKFDVKVLKRRELERQISSIEAGDYMQWLWAELQLAYCKDLPDVGYVEPVANRMCPEVKPTSVREYLEKFSRGS